MSGFVGMVQRTTNSVFRLRCCERPEVSSSAQVRVGLVIFDFDETLTLITLMTPDGSLPHQQEEWAVKVNFESPWVEGSRVAKLDKMLEELRDNDGEHDRRTLAILTRNGNAAGVSAVINLLRAAKLDHHFGAMWTLPRKKGRWNGAFLHEGKWELFHPPPPEGSEHKADVLMQIAKNPRAWFPQMELPARAAAFTHLGTLSLEEIVLVDDQRTNFQSNTGQTVKRYVKVARYDAQYREFGFMKNMGGIGGNDDADYDSLLRFVQDPWMCKDTYQIRCQERDFPGSEKHMPVQLIVFDFDETLTMATFMPDDAGFLTEVGAEPQSWKPSELVTYNFESPFSEGSRVSKLKQLLKMLTAPKEGTPRTLAILTKNEHGVVAVLNLLKFAGLADYFSAIWTLHQKENRKRGAYMDDKGQWQTFDTPADIREHKADVLNHVAAHPEQWFPQLSTAGGGSACASLKELSLQGIVLVDDERTNFRNYDRGSGAKILRYCKVARYDEHYRDCGLLNQMGGLGAHGEGDFAILMHFIENPWEYPYESLARPGLGRTHSIPLEVEQSDEMLLKESSMFRRDSEPAEEEPDKAPRIRLQTAAPTAAPASDDELTKLEDFLDTNTNVDV